MATQRRTEPRRSGLVRRTGGLAAALGPLSQDKPAEAPAPSAYAPPPLQQQPATATAFDYAGFWQRFGAWVIDLIILTIPSMIVMYLLGGMEAYKHLLEQLQSGNDMSAAIREYGTATESSSVASLFIAFFYYVFFEASKWQATPGKLALRLRVTDVNGKRVTLGRAAARNVVRLSALIFGLIPVICYIASRGRSASKACTILWPAHSYSTAPLRNCRHNEPSPATITAASTPEHTDTRTARPDEVGAVFFSCSRTDSA